jgi:hypothetical protein
VDATHAVTTEPDLFKNMFCLLEDGVIGECINDSDDICLSALSVDVNALGAFVVLVHEPFLQFFQLLCINFSN